MPQKIIFDEQQKQNIIRLYNEHVSCKQIGKQFGCSKQKINAVLRENNILLRDASHANRKYNINEDIFETIDTHEKAYWLGILAGDGTVNDDYVFGLSLQEKDKDHVQKFKDFLGAGHPIYVYNNRPKKDGSPSISYMLLINNKKIVCDLHKYGIIPNKTKEMSFPNLPNEFLSSYMLGLIDSDGSINLKSHYKNKNKKLLNFNFVGPIKFAKTFQQKLIEKCQISKTKLGTQKHTDFVRIVEYGGYKNIYKIIQFLYSASPIFLHRKRDIAINYLLDIYPDDKWLNQQKQITSK
jgi:hypothetical protein